MTSESALFFEKIYKEKLNEKVLKISQIYKGYESKAYFIETNKSSTVIRIPKEGKNGVFSREYQLLRHYWASGILEKTKVPISKALVLDISKDLVPFNYLISKKVEGEPVDFNKLNKKDSEKILKQLVSHLKEIHEIKTEDYGLLIGKKKGNKDSWDLAYDLAIDLIQGLKQKQLIKDELGNKILKFFNENKKYIELDDPRLIHNDLSSDHILVKDKKISAIIDFGDAMSGDPLCDLARFYVLNFYNLEEERVDKVVEMYGDVDKKRFNFYLMYQACWYKSLQLKHLHPDKKYDEVSNYLIDKILQEASS